MSAWQCGSGSFGSSPVSVKLTPPSLLTAWVRIFLALWVDRWLRYTRPSDSSTTAHSPTNACVSPPGVHVCPASSL